SQMPILGFDEPAVMIEPDLRRPAAARGERGPALLREDLAFTRRRLDIAAPGDARQLAHHGERIAHVLEEMRAEDEIEEFVGKGPGRDAGVVEEPCGRAEPFA